MKRYILLYSILILVSSAIAQDKIKVACVGNSVTYGYGHEEPAKTSYPSQLAVMLGDSYEVGNFGKSGATLLKKGHRPYMQQEEFRKAIDFVPDIAIIHLGLNDTDPRNWKYYKNEFIADYISLIEAFEEVNPDVDIFICRMSPIFHWHHRFKTGTRDWYWEIQETIENIAHNIAEVKIIDLQELLYHRPDLMPDALHPNPEGAAIIAERVYSAITGDFGGLSLPDIFSDNMIIQHGIPFSINGTANANETISVRLDNKTIKTQADYNGKWEVTFDAAEADNKKHKLTIKSKDKTLSFSNILVGEVILCSSLVNLDDLSAEYTEVTGNNNIRLYNMKAPDIKDNIAWDTANFNRHNFYLPASWNEIDKTNTNSVLYNIGVKLSDSLQMPIGLICNCVEDASIESFIDKKTLEWENNLLEILYEWRNNDLVMDYCHPHEPSYLYTSGIAPISSFPINSVIWFKNDSDETDNLENIKMTSLISSWRNAWNNNDLRFMIKTY